ncbi:MAG: hypothetical protein P1U56_22250 [Saprospiraceae bacterium]|nr:hypothetical protein [Saprospiraceae bacterium]
MKTLWQKWTVHCALGELLGIGAAGALAFLVNSWLGDPHSLAEKLIVMVAMVAAGCIEGFILGFFQWRVMVQKFTLIPRKEWMFYTILVAALGWFLGMLPSLFFDPSVAESESSHSSLNFNNPLIFAFLSLSVGLLLGALFGLFQWISLKKYSLNAYYWIIANALGWGLGLGWIYLFASFPSTESSISFTVTMGITGGILCGLSVGAITSLFLLRLQPKPEKFKL